MMMRIFHRSVLQTCAALATTLRPRSVDGLVVVTPPLRQQQRRPIVSTTRLLVDKNFVPAAPPGTRGVPVFADVELDVVSADARQRKQDPNAVFVVTGTSRGIGLQFVKSLTTTTQGTIVACCRTPDQATQLQNFRNSLTDPSRIHILALDLQDQSSIEACGAAIRDKYHRVDVLLNVAGLLGDGRTTPGPERSISQMERDWFDTSLAVNVVGPVMLTKELVPLLRQSRGRRQSDNDDTPKRRPVALVANLSARVGSITDNGLGGWYSYRISKAALNQATRTMALELGRQSVWCVALHPGTTDTDLSKPFQANVKKESLFPVDFTVNQLLSVMDSVQAEHSGGLYDWAGKAISF